MRLTMQTHPLMVAGDTLSDRQDILSVLWAITKSCNHQCSYCVYYKPIDKHGLTPTDQLIRAAEKLLALGRPGYQITLYGGEPTLHPGILALITAILASPVEPQLRIFTNGSRDARFFKSLSEVAATPRFGIIFSAHLAFIDVNRFVGSVEASVAGGIRVAVNVMYDHHHDSTARRLVTGLLTLRANLPFFIEINFPYDIDGAMAEGATEAQLAWIEAQRVTLNDLNTLVPYASPNFVRITFNMITQSPAGRQTLSVEESLHLLAALHTPIYTGFHCLSGTNVWFIEEDGAVRGGVCEASQPLGNIFHDSEIELTQSMAAIPCRATACKSIENIPLPKFRDAAEGAAHLSQYRARAKRYLYQHQSSR
jgi:MoaA/NifB/PqqE/SkfB family radical SAM enzyme